MATELGRIPGVAKPRTRYIVLPGYPRRRKDNADIDRNRQSHQVAGPKRRNCLYLFQLPEERRTESGELTLLPSEAVLPASDIFARRIEGTLRLPQRPQQADAT